MRGVVDLHPGRVHEPSLGVVGVTTVQHGRRITSEFLVARDLLVSRSVDDRAEEVRVVPHVTGLHRRELVADPLLQTPEE